MNDKIINKWSKICNNCKNSDKNIIETSRKSNIFVN